MQAKDIPDEAILTVVRANPERWTLIWDLEDRMPGVPRKVILAKCRSLIKRGKMFGCTCGCRGDFRMGEYD